MHHLFACIARIKRGTHIHNGASTTSSLTIGFPNIELTDIPSLKSIDPLIVIVEIRRMDIQSLCSLSTTCRVLREASMPLLFYTTRSRTASGHAGPDHAQWKRRALHILDDCLDEPFKTRVAGELVLHSLSCGLYDPLFLGNALRKMPALAKVEVGLLLAFERRQLTPHELPWATVQAILSVPHLQCFTVDSHRLTPWMLPGESYRPDALSPGLTAFQYRLVYYHEYLRYTPEEQAFKVTLILKTYHPTLQKLELPIALLPIPALHTLQWPVLHELRFYGGQEPGKAHLVSSALVNMAALRVLDLTVTVDDSAVHVPEPIWQRSDAASFPCQNLQRLIITLPCVEDALFPSLPHTLRELSLVCHPHKSLAKIRGIARFGDADDGWTRNLLRASDVLRILEGCTLPSLRVLGVEYAEDDDEVRLLQHIGTSFPDLAELTLLRYRHADRKNTIISADDFAGALSCPAGLRILSLHIDPPDSPRARFIHYQSIGISTIYDQEIPEDHIEQKLNPVAGVLARTLPPSATTVRLLLSSVNGFHWIEYSINRSDEECRAVRLPNDPASSSQDFLSFYSPRIARPQA
ncbi:hypothetical protein NUW54_g3512 [Trametes sanguinea]|uniref:Uncharacterized protein n=1 Tax=Trametes sanguinea TaxID=158606 RepID=A0ACC1Q272_9APHY|nr:hypothetical protein NUW54_g3512 [Trametes sanguinea]